MDFQKEAKKIINNNKDIKNFFFEEAYKEIRNQEKKLYVNISEETFEYMLNKINNPNNFLVSFILSLDDHFRYTRYQFIKDDIKILNSLRLIEQNGQMNAMSLDDIFTTKEKPKEKNTKQTNTNIKQF